MSLSSEKANKMSFEHIFPECPEWKLLFYATSSPSSIPNLESSCLVVYEQCIAGAMIGTLDDQNFFFLSSARFR